jgi:NAD(P)-dependent dehydrogenase (short-subunit alcohol dehydrogenase family)
MRMRYIVVTGGSRGIGAAIAEAFLKQGATVGLVAQNAQRLHETVQALQSQYGKDSVLSWAGDLSNADACKSICEQITNQLPVVD